VIEIDVTGPMGAVVDRSYTYDYSAGSPGPVDPGPNLDRLVDHLDPSQSRFYFYDELDRLWKATDLSGAPLYSYTYDAVGSRQQETSPAGTTTTSYETGTDRIAEQTGTHVVHYAHDAFGSRIYAGALPYAGDVPPSTVPSAPPVPPRTPSVSSLLASCGDGAGSPLLGPGQLSFSK